MNQSLLLSSLALCLLFVVPACNVGDDDDAANDDDAVDTCAAAVPCLGDYSISNSLDLDAIALCESISGDLRFDDEEWLTSIELPCLTSVGGDLQITSNPVLCQSLVDAFVAACVGCGPVVDISGNDDGC
jgi:hypothetical protein